MKIDENSDIKESLDSSAQKNNGLVKYGEAELKKDYMVGLSKVDLLDIRPPQILLIQKSSDLENFVDTKGNKPQLGQFFHTGKFEIMDSFECYFLFASKSKYTSKIKPEEGEKDQYKAIGLMADDLSIFGMIFRSSSLYTLSGLYTACLSQKRPMFSIKVKIETKDLQNDKGKWWIPVLRITDFENDPTKLDILHKHAVRYDSSVKEVLPEEEVDVEGEPDEPIPF